MNKPESIMCVRPRGTASVLSPVSSYGVEPQYAQRYIRNIIEQEDKPKELIPHFHHDIIVLWAAGYTVQYLCPRKGYWKTTANPTWNLDTQYRLEP